MLLLRLAQTLRVHHACLINILSIIWSAVIVCNCEFGGISTLGIIDSGWNRTVSVIVRHLPTVLLIVFYIYASFLLAHIELHSAVELLFLDPPVELQGVFVEPACEGGWGGAAGDDLVGSSDIAARQRRPCRLLGLVTLREGWRGVAVWVEGEAAVGQHVSREWRGAAMSENSGIEIIFRSEIIPIVLRIHFYLIFL